MISECLTARRKREKQKDPKRKGLTSLLSKPGLVLRIKFLFRLKHLRLILLWRFMNHSYQMVLCHLIVIMPVLSLSKSYEIPELLNPLFWQIPRCFLRRLPLGHVSLFRVYTVECGFVNVPLHTCNIYVS